MTPAELIVRPGGRPVAVKVSVSPSTSAKALVTLTGVMARLSVPVWLSTVPTGVGASLTGLTRIVTVSVSVTPVGEVTV